MKPKTSFKLLGCGVVYCWCGALLDLIDDINTFILPILEDKITARFNDREIIVYAYDNVDTICKRFIDELNK